MPPPTFPPFPSLPDTQALNSTTFSKPPLAQRALTLPELYDWHGKHSPNHPSVVYTDGSGGMQTIYWAELSRAVHTAAHFVQSFVHSRGESAPVIAILAATESITYLTLIIGILRAGFCVFPISPRNSPKAVAHLLEETRASYLLIGAEPMFHDLAQSAFSLLPEQTRGNSMIVVRDMPTFDLLFLDQTQWQPFPERTFQMDELAMIQHSSGSTAFPKPIYWPHGALLETGITPYFGEMDLCGLIFGCQAIPMFHGLGTTMAIMAACSGIVLAFFTPSTPAIVPNPDNFFTDMVKLNTDIACSVPVFIESWSRNQDYVLKLAKMKGVLYGGGPLDKTAGDTLASQGVSIYVTYASSEGGVLSAYLNSHPGMDWEYFRFSGHTRPHFIPYDEDIVEVVFEAHPGHHPRIINSDIQGREAYSSNDLLVRHPQDPMLFKVYGRSDDQIMLSTGEKTNPGPLESILARDPHVKAAVMFGRGRFQSGVLIAPAEEYISVWEDEHQLAAFCNAIWPSVKKVNEMAPSHSRLFREMIIVANPSKPFTYTVKGTPRRQAILEDYAKEIEALYNGISSSTRVDVPLPSLEWQPDETRAFVRRVVGSIMKDMSGVGDEVDLFRVGCDSLQAIWIRNSLQQALAKSGKRGAARAMSENVVYHYPTIASLATHLSSAVSTSQATLDRLGLQITEVQTMLAKYTVNFPSHLKRHPETSEQANAPRATFLNRITSFFSINKQTSPNLLSPNASFRTEREYMRSHRKRSSTLNAQISIPEQHGHDLRLSHSHSPVDTFSRQRHRSISIVTKVSSNESTPKKRRGHGKRLSISSIFSPLSNHVSNSPDVVYLESPLRTPALTGEKRHGHRKRMSLSTPSPPIQDVKTDKHKRRWSLSSKLTVPSSNTATQPLSPLPPLSWAERDVIVVTGTTGGLGSNILYHLVLDPKVKRVYALNRKTEGKSLKERQEDALKWTEELDEKTNVLLFGKLKLLECQFDQPGFGLASEVLEDIRREATHIIHNAWQVDFNHTLSFFEPQVMLVRQLVDLALSSMKPLPPRFLFVSSVGVCYGLHSNPVKEEIIESPPKSGSGYGQSKWIAEHILLAAARNTTLRPTVVRLGQISGDPSGYWNEREWFPSLVKSANVTHCLPDIPGGVSWISAHVAAKALTEMRNAEVPVLHVAHPHPISWKSIIEPLAQTLSAEIVDYRQWVAVLESQLSDGVVSAVDIKRNPALRLVNFFKSIEIEEHTEPVGVPRLSVAKAVTISPTLASAEPLQPRDVEGWVEAWRKRQFI